MTKPRQPYVLLLAALSLGLGAASASSLAPAKRLAEPVAGGWDAIGVQASRRHLPIAQEPIRPSPIEQELDYLPART